jgi:hypothetical protein
VAVRLKRQIEVLAESRKNQTACVENVPECRTLELAPKKNSAFGLDRQQKLGLAREVQVLANDSVQRALSLPVRF